MKVIDLKSEIVAVPVRKSATTFTLGDGLWRMVVIVEVFTDEGFVGLGEAVPPFHNMDMEATKRLIDSAKPLLVGEDVFSVEPIKKKLYAAYNLAHLHIHAANWTVNAIEMALWDLVGKGCDKGRTVRV